MNKKLIITLGLVMAVSASTISAFADTTIYTDGIGRLHFLGRDAKNSTGTGANYTNSAAQDLTKKLYDQAESGVINDTSYQQHPLKNYENTFPDSRFGTSNVWRTKYANNEDYGPENAKSNKAMVTATKGATDISNPYVYGTTILNDTEENVKKTSTKKHWWNKKK